MCVMCVGLCMYVIRVGMLCMSAMYVWCELMYERILRYGVYVYDAMYA